MKDNELFELCREVYKRFPDWTDTSQCIWNGQIEQPNQATIDWAINDGYVGYTPLYTSDYLLEKLPHKITNRVGHYLELCPVTPNGVKGWRAGYTHEPFTQYADTPLKALLKLTIALHEAGELQRGIDDAEGGQR